MELNSNQLLIVNRRWRNLAGLRSFLVSGTVFEPRFLRLALVSVEDYKQKFFPEV